MIRLLFTAQGALKVMRSDWFVALRELLGGRAWEVLHRLWLLRRRVGLMVPEEIAAALDWPGSPERLLGVLLEFGVLRQVRGRWVVNEWLPPVPPRRGVGAGPLATATLEDLRVLYGGLCQRIRDLEQRMEQEEDPGLEAELRRLRQQRERIRERQLEVVVSEN